MRKELKKKLAALPTLSTSALGALWKTSFGRPTPPKLRRQLVVPILAYRLQELSLGSLTNASRVKLQQLAQAFERNPYASLSDKPAIRAGTQFVRHWHGERHEVTAVSRGFEYRGRTFTSLSEIARQITGTRWSGPAFFGVKPRAGGGK